MKRTAIKRKRKPAHWNPIPGALDKRSHYTKDGREELYGVDKSNRRAEIFERAGGRCEEVGVIKTDFGNYIGVAYSRCPNRATEWSHNRHGHGFRDDALKAGIASCKECHVRKHAGTKFLPTKVKEGIHDRP